MLRKPLTAKCCDVVKKDTFYFFFYKDLKKKEKYFAKCRCKVRGHKLFMTQHKADDFISVCKA